ncbi:uncharacterized protein BP01DRAFT_416442 [Aspergillus saccharolyticus JOP 1030-1]|uniref:Histidine acid phosphatase n=1 Tax=Aspergillus saccharolyticus JOP 1030-1 TaxID=1450539 RepID=A0A318ZWK6_9EURO|nr:histidine acid phosphatase [Aspergillus saccharolyticus JOP 1030-1]PYH44508.1 histidine acid phosphatase [Aspergillus saccharolyticus JOP 1030-1]
MRSTRDVLLALAAAVLQTTAPVSAESLKEQVWAVFAYTLHGDSVPAALPRESVVTPYGASELYAAGSAFRDRYVAIHSTDVSPSTRIERISSYVLADEDIKVLTTTDASVIGSAQAFMQGLYPALNETYDAQFFDPIFLMSNGSVTTGPLGGYQYARIVSASLDDPQSVTVAGHQNCKLHQTADSEYRNSLEAQDLVQTSGAFYNRLYEFSLRDTFDRSSANYLNAVSIAEFLQYEYLHNETLLHSLNEDDIKLANWYADQYTFATSGNTTFSSPVQSGNVRAVAGRTMASRILDAFNTNIFNRGDSSKLTFLFGNAEPAVALTSILRLPSPQQSNFYSRPALGASIIFELFSLENDSYPTYPDPSQLYVRLLLRNGTDVDAEFHPYPLFGLSPSNTDVSYSEFEAELTKVALNSTEAWCLQCGSSSAVFCPGILEADTSTTSQKNSNNSNNITPGVAGVIGAIVTLVVIGMVAAAGFLFFGIRMRRQYKSNLTDTKGGIKLASDSNLALRENM